MNLIIILLYCCFAFIQFLIFNVESKNKESSNIFKILFSLIYIIIISAIFKDIGFRQFNDYIFLIPIFEFIIRIYYTNYILRQDLFLYDKSIFKTYFISIFICYIININFINKVNNIFLTPSELRIVLWLIIIYSMYTYLKNDFEKLIDDKKEPDLNKNSEYYVISYAKLKNKYKNIIINKDKDIIDITYAIMVYENNKRPLFLRKIDLFKSKFTTDIKKQGIMQIESNEFITDIDSILFTIKSLEEIIKKSKNKDIENIIKTYYKKDPSYKEVFHIYNCINEFNNN